MHASLEQQLKEFEKDLSVLLVRFMKIYDELERERARPGSLAVPSFTPADLRRPPDGGALAAYS